MPGKTSSFHSEDYLILGCGLAGTALALSLEFLGKPYRILKFSQKDSASQKAAGLMNPVTGRRMALTWNFHEIWPQARQFYADAFQLLTGKTGSFLEKRAIRKVLHHTEEMNFLEAKSAWAGYGDLVKISSMNPGETSLYTHQIGWADIDEGYRLDVPGFLFQCTRFFTAKNRIMEQEFDPGKLSLHHDFCSYDGITYRYVISCLGLGCPWIAPELWPVKGQLFVLKGLPDWGAEVRKTEHFLIPLSDGKTLAGSTYEREFEHNLPDEQGLASVLEGLDTEVKALVRSIDSWAGLRPTSKDRRPVIRQINANLFGINALGTKGVSLAPWSANTLLKLIADLPESKH